MKKFISIIIAVLLITALLASCASSGSSSPTSGADYGKGNEAPASAAPPDGGSGPGKPVTDEEQGLGSSGTNGTINPSFTEKIIYSYSGQIETTKFEESLDNVDMLLSKYGAFIQSSYVSGNSFGKTTFRSADYTIRVPVKNFLDLTGSLSILGNVSSESTNAQNITAQFMDTEARLKTYETEESRLLVMLEKATTVADMITIEQRLSDVRYQIESLTSTLKNWQNQVDYSTVTIHIAEVEELTEQVPAQRSYWEQISDGFRATLKGIGSFFKGLFMGIVVALPVLLILAVIAVIVIIIIRAVNKKNRTESNQNTDKKE